LKNCPHELSSNLSELFSLLSSKKRRTTSPMWVEQIDSSTRCPVPCPMAPAPCHQPQARPDDGARRQRLGGLGQPVSALEVPFACAATEQRRVFRAAPDALLVLGPARRAARIRRGIGE